MIAFLAFAAISFAGSLVSSALQPKPPTIGKLDNLDIPRAELGASIPIVYGQARVSGNTIYSTQLDQAIKKGKGGFLGIGRTPDTVKYTSTTAVFGFCEGQIQQFDKFFAGGKLVATTAQPTSKYLEGLQTRLGSSDDALYQTSYTETTASTIPGGTVITKTTNFGYPDDLLASKYNYLAKALFGIFKVSYFGNQIPKIEAILTGFNNSLTFIVTDALKRAEIPANKINVSRLDGIILHGATFNRSEETTADFLNDLALMYNFTLYIDDYGVIRARLNGDAATPEYIIPDARLHWRDNKSAQTPGIIEEASSVTDLPSSIKLSFANINNDFEISSVTVTNNNVKHRNNITMQTRVCLSDSQARNIATRLMSGYYDQRYVYKNITLGTEYRIIQVADLIQFNHSGRLIRARVTKKEQGANGMISLEAVSIGLNRVNQDVTISSDVLYNPQIVITEGVFAAIPLEIPFTLANPGYSPTSNQIALQTTNDLLGGSVTQTTLNIDIDFRDGNSYVDVGKLTRIGTGGSTLTVLNTDTNNVITDQVLDVQFSYLGGAPPTIHNLQSNTRLLWIKGEVIGYKTITHLGGLNYRYSGLIRGMFGTEDLIISRPIATAVFVMTEANMYYLPADNSVVGDDLSYKITTDTQVETDVPNFDKVHTGRALKPYTVTQLKAIALANGDMLLTWSNRARYNNGGFNPTLPNTEPTATYAITINNTLNLTSTTPDVTITAAQLTSLGIDNLTTITVMLIKEDLLDSEPLVTSLPVLYRIA
jgi:hypothetical protein